LESNGLQTSKKTGSNGALKRAGGYSFLNLLAVAAGRHKWPPAWSKRPPRGAYDAVIIGGGGHGLAAAYYLARNHGVSRVAVLEKGWIGGGNTGRNTTIVRSNYLLKETATYFEFSLKLWESLSRELNFNVMFSPRGVVNLFHSPQEREALLRRQNAMILNGIEADVLSLDQLRKLVPALDTSPDARFPVAGAVIQRRAGTARHDAVAWGYARAASSLGVDIIENCEVLSIETQAGAVSAVETTLGRIETRKLGVAVSGHSSQLAAMAGLILPIETHLLQACVTEPIKPFLDCVVSSGTLFVYLSQTAKGELVIGGKLDGYNSFSQRGDLAVLEENLSHAVTLFPRISRLRVMRQWAGAVDMTMDGSPILGLTPVRGVYLDAGWCYGGFKATPAAGWTLAHVVANDKPHPIAAPFALARFADGRMVSERGAGPRPNAH
jgi:heterotetrameric sarcosine oxidase beta subunit